MTTDDAVLDLVDDPKARAFVGFMRGASRDTGFPDYRHLDFMEVPGLVAQIFVADFRRGMDDGIRIHFSGRMIDDYFGCNIQGRILDEVYNGSDGIDTVRAIYRRCFEEGMICVRIKRSTHDFRIKGPQDVLQSFVLWPCSPDGETVDYAVGFATVRELDGAAAAADVLEFFRV
jgi:hypothetical protein